MRYTFSLLLLLTLVGAGCFDSGSSPYTSTSNSYSNYRYDRIDDYDYGYEWAEDEDIDNFDDCQDEFGTSDAEDGCNDYVRDNYSGYRSFGGYDCTEDCGGHEAGYEWAENNDIYDVDDCGGNSDSFIEGCWQYIEDTY
jgi:hypothetical protein